MVWHHHRRRIGRTAYGGGERGLTLDIYYTNLEGAAISRIYQAVRDGVDGLVMNPAGFLYAGYALKDCLKSIPLPYIEVHMTNIDKREKTSVTAAESDGMITGLGVRSYVLALDAVAGVISDRRAATKAPPGQDHQAAAP